MCFKIWTSIASWTIVGDMNVTMWEADASALLQVFLPSPGCLFEKTRSFDSPLDIWCLFDWHGHYSLMRHANTTKQGKKRGTKWVEVWSVHETENSDGKRAESCLRSLCVQNFSAFSYSTVYFSSKILSCAIWERWPLLLQIPRPHECSLCLDGFLPLRIKPS